jgi:hypothetical protein
MHKIQVWAVGEGSNEPTGAIRGVVRGEGSRTRAGLELIELDQGELRNRIEAFLSEFSEIHEPEHASFIVDEIELALTVNAKGGVALIGKLEAGGEAGIKVTIRRRER